MQSRKIGESETAIGKEAKSRGSVKFRGAKKRVRATRALHRLVNRDLIVPEEVNLTLVSEVMAPSAKQHHFFIPLLRSFLPHSPPVLKRLCLGQRYGGRREPEIKGNSAHALLQHVYFCMEKGVCRAPSTSAAEGC